jgi:kinesin family member 20
MKVENDTSLLVRIPSVSHIYRSAALDMNKQWQRFTFSHIFGEESTQKSVFEKGLLPSLKDFLNGQNCLLFTYGVTNSGKTYTIHGNILSGF